MAVTHLDLGSKSFCDFFSLPHLGVCKYTCCVGEGVVNDSSGGYSTTPTYLVAV